MKTKTCLKLLLPVLLMVLILIPCTAHAAGGDVPIDLAHFEDSIFCSYVYNNFDKDRNGSLDPSEISAVTDIDVSGKGIKSLMGVEYFTELKRLHCGQNELSSLDVSKNLELTYLSCEENKLERLLIGENKELDALYCYENRLLTLAVAGCSRLKTLSCAYNVEMTYLDCSGCSLTSLYVNGCSKLVTLACNNNQLSDLDVSDNTELEYLYCYTNKLTELDVSQNNKLTMLFCGNNPITDLNVSLHGSLRTLNVANCAALKQLLCSNCALTGLNVSGCYALETLNCAQNQLELLDIQNDTALIRLVCRANALSTLNVSNNKSLKYLYCGENALSALELGSNSDLEVLSCQFNKLSQLDISNNTKLQILICFGNSIASLDISKCPQLLMAYQEGPDYEDVYGDAEYVAYHSSSVPDEIYLHVDKATSVKGSDAKTASVSGISLNLEGKISVQFKIKPSDDAAYAQLRYENEDGTYGDVVATVSLDKTTSDAYQADKDLFLVAYSEITSREMTLHVMLNIIDKDGNPMNIYRTTNEKTYAPDELIFSAADWANAIIEKNGTDKSNKSSWIAMALLNFGGEAQKYFKDFNSDAPANPNGYLADDMAGFKPDAANDMFVSEGAKDKGYSGTALDLAADTTVRVKFTGKYSVKLDGKDATLVEEDGKYVLDIKGLRCIDLDQVFDVTFTGEGGYAGEIKASALGWCNAVIEKNTSAAPLAKAVCLYSQAAENYFAK